ncbi:S-adenosyl-L-methionine-dependent methyltransferase [Apodospora peruviana]|uniref:S-adenosyl-L-methionine-dependent methyltransferase n=1 Tax=Apodospora peruviana TaxID=516989 RepID=A0AAE0I054_9PEZI|nr:S-adenosyl-L-methionine-dependent methyltransferase [Apodospora peruviana]
MAIQETFARDEAFWNNYLAGRPQAPDALFDRIFTYHRSQGGSFGTVHDVGAGNGPYTARLRSHFEHVIVSDIVPGNVELARARLGSGTESGFTFRTAGIEEVDDLDPASVDMVFATNVMHFPDDQHAAMAAVARQLRPGGTFACAGFAPARFRDAAVQAVWERIFAQGGRVLLRKLGVEDDSKQAPSHREKALRAMARSGDRYDVAPLDPAVFVPGALRIHIEMEAGTATELLPPEEAQADTFVRPAYAGPDDIELWEHEDGWAFETDLAGIKTHFATFPFSSQEPEAFVALWEDMERLLVDRKLTRVKGFWPAKVILATKR